MLQDGRMFFTAKEWEGRLPGLDSVAAVFARQDGEVVTKSGTTEVRRIGNLFIKKYWVTHPNQVLSGATRGALFGKSKVRREFENLVWLRAHGFDAPAPVAYGEERRARCLMRSCLITEAVAEAVGFDAICRARYCVPSGGRTARNSVPYKFADHLRRLHEQHFIHRDLFWRNILVAGNRFYLIDAHKGGYRRGTRAHDLATLDAPAPAFFRRTERLRFFLRYLNHQKLTAADKRLARQVLRLAAPLREKQIGRVRRGR
jgi:tRNA A-37 threonylcarbamoyl transferase component Bud32